MKKIYFMIAILLFAFNSMAQNQEVINFEPEVAKQRIKDKVEDYQYQLEILANGKNQQSTRNSARDAAKDLFLSRGGNYTYNLGSQTMYDKCEMQTINKYRPQTIYKKLVKSYLEAMALRPYRVEITATKEVVVDQLRKTGPDTWMAVAHIGQKYQQYNNDYRPGYSDITFKDMVAFVHVVVDPYGVSYIVMLENCNVTGVEDVPFELQ